MGVLEGVLDATRGSWACWYSGKTLIVSGLIVSGICGGLGSGCTRRCVGRDAGVMGMLVFW